MNHLHNLTILLLLLPLIASVIIILGSKYLTYKLTGMVAILTAGGAAVIANYFLYQFIAQTITSIQGDWYVWIEVASIKFKFGFLLDRLSIMLLSMLSCLGLIIQLYSVNYLYKSRDKVTEIAFNKLFGYINFCMFTMILLVISNNLLQLLIGWELLGLGVYLLINFYHDQEIANVSGFKAWLINHIGDCSLILAIAAIMAYCGGLDYVVIFNNLPNPDYSHLIAGLLLLAAVAKSAQMPFHVWLLETVVAPIPAVIFLHSVVMVAGIFLLLRVMPILELSANWLNMVVMVGAVTAVLTGILAIVETDIKKIMVYATNSQLGVMLATIGVGNQLAGVLHVISHGFAKGLWWLLMGIILLVVKRDGSIGALPINLRIKYQWWYWVMLVAILAVAGCFCFTGFIANDLMLKSMMASSLPFAAQAKYWLLITIAITVLYGFRLFFKIFHNDHAIQARQFDNIVGMPMMIAVGLLVVVNLLLPLLLQQIANNLLDNIWRGLASQQSICWVLGGLIAWVSFVYRNHYLTAMAIKIKNNFLFVSTLLANRYFFDDIIRFIANSIKYVADKLVILIDEILINKLLCNGLNNLCLKCAKGMQAIYSNYLNNYILLMFTGMIVILLWILISTC